MRAEVHAPEGDLRGMICRMPEPVRRMLSVEVV